jgi:NPCBM-associated, NEW3 domain of alpha-galactosidase
VAYPRAGRGRARSQTRPFKLDRPSNFSRFRIEFGGTAVRLAEVELLTTEKRAAMPLEADVEGGVGEAGSTVQINVKLANWGDAPLRSELTATVPDRWTVAPTPAPFSPIASGDSQTVTLDVTIPADAELSSYPIEVVATSRRATAKASGNVNVIGDVIEFTRSRRPRSRGCSTPAHRSRTARSTTGTRVRRRRALLRLLLPDRR